jgi:hypothetical protein
MSVLLLYRRLASGSCSKTFKWAIWAAIAFVVLYTITYTILLVTACNPVEAQWLQYDLRWAKTHKFKCLDPNIQKRTATSAGALSTFTDLYSVMLPAILLVRIRIQKRQRWGLLFIFGLGYV